MSVISATSSRLSTLKAPSNSTNSTESFAQPVVCFRTGCSYPYGSACESCVFQLKLQRRGSTSQRRVGEWVMEIKVQTYVAEQAGMLLIGGAGEGVIVDALVGEKDEGKSDREASRGGETERNEGMSIIAFDYQADEAEDFKTGEYTGKKSRDEEDREQTDHCSSARQKLPGPSDISSLLTFSNIFARTLQGQGQEQSLVEGAEEEEEEKEEDLTKDNCPFCHTALGDPRFQHLLKCKYAHKEAQALEQALSRLVRR